MALTLSQAYKAIAPGLTASFVGLGGTSPYTYAVLPGGAGGTINGAGLYTAPAVVSQDPLLVTDTIKVTDSVAATAQATIAIGTPLALLSDIIQTYMVLPNDHIYWWDQKIFQPTDSNLYVIMSVENAKCFGNTSDYDSSGNNIQVLNMHNTIGINIVSRGPDARDKKELILLALASHYAKQQMDKNAFLIGSIPTQFNNLSVVDGPAIPYRFHISVGIQYAFTKTIATDYYDQIQAENLVLDP